MTMSEAATVKETPNNSLPTLCQHVPDFRVAAGVDPFGGKWLA